MRIALRKLLFGVVVLPIFFSGAAMAQVKKSEPIKAITGSHVSAAGIRHESDAPEHPAGSQPTVGPGVKMVDPGTVIAGAEALVGIMATLIGEMKVDRDIAVGIDNYTNSNLVRPETYIYSGQIPGPPPPIIQAGTADAASFEKTNGVGRGTVGVLTYIIEGTQYKFAILWSVPYSYTLPPYFNYYNVRIIPKSTPTDVELYNAMYKEATKAGTNISTVEKNFAIGGAGATVGQAQLRVSIRQKK
ncbi:MAG: hypothetical protein AAB241_04500 [Pseudomonadota bacterium]